MRIGWMRGMRQVGLLRARFSRCVWALRWLMEGQDTGDGLSGWDDKSKCGAEGEVGWRGG